MGWQKITDGWLYVDGEYLGAYTLPAIVPVLAEGENEVILFPGVKENGIEATPNIYPYLTQFAKHYTLNAGQTTAVQPVTDYDPKIKCMPLEMAAAILMAALSSHLKTGTAMA